MAKKDKVFFSINLYRNRKLHLSTRGLVFSKRTHDKHLAWKLGLLGVSKGELQKKAVDFPEPPEEKLV